MVARNGVATARSVGPRGEPHSNLDASRRRGVRKEILRRQQNLESTVVHLTDDHGEAIAALNRIIVMNNAVITQNGTSCALANRMGSRPLSERHAVAGAWPDAHAANAKPANGPASKR